MQVSGVRRQMTFFSGSVSAMRRANERKVRTSKAASRARHPRTPRRTKAWVKVAGSGSASSCSDLPLVLTTPREAAEALIGFYAKDVEEEHEIYFDLKSMTELAGDKFEKPLRGGGSWRRSSSPSHATSGRAP